MLGFLDDTINHDRKVRCLPSVTPECNVRSDTLATVPSMNSLTLYCQPASVWNCRLDGRSPLRVDSPSHSRVLSTLLSTLSTFEMGILAMWMMENVCFLSGHLFLTELSPRRKCYGIHRRRERSRSREVCQSSLLFSLLSSGWKIVAPKKALNSS